MIGDLVDIWDSLVAIAGGSVVLAVSAIIVAIWLFRGRR